LDRWFQIMGINPLHANQLFHPSLTNNTCGDVWFQHEWQHSDRVGRDAVAMAIQAAEAEISAEAGYNLMPDWVAQERLNFPRPAVPEAYGVGSYNQRWQNKSIELRKAHIISGGVKTKTLIEAGATFERQDLDTDTFQETCKVTVATTVTDENEIRVFYPGKEGKDIWEIRPIAVTISGGNAVITFKVWQIVAANQMETIDPEAIDATDDHNYESTVDVYRVYNDPQTQVLFMWENSTGEYMCNSCNACEYGTQSGCFHIRDERLGFVVPVPATWNSDDESFTTAYWSVCRDPDQIKAWYYSGYQDLNLERPKADMAPYWEYAIAYYAASKLDRPVCGCSNVQQFIDKWRLDAMANDREDVTLNITPELLANKLGATMGAIYAYKRIHQNGIRVIK